ncbi:MAG: ATP-binding protein [Lentimicrobiaceae bacterium]|nr:ATP-binding protein [Lentimicrobiaceae bacterium]
MKREIYEELLRWKNNLNRKPLVITGARQVGKTWIMREFGRNEYDDVVYINCDNEKRMETLLSDDYNIDRILLGLQAISGINIKSDKTLIILDEIQEVPRGLHLLKYFYEEAPEYHIMVAGSLLGIILNRGVSFPVGKVDIMELHPMNFNEFLEAMGQEQLLKVLDSNDWKLIDILSSKYIELLRQYYFVGGMPEAVLSYSNSKDIAQVRDIQSNILKAYRNDISKHATKSESIKIGQVLDSLPSQLSKENKKFIYGVIKSGARASEFELAIQWLIDAGIIHKVNRIKEARMPLKFYEDISAFKLFLLDLGLFACMCEVPASEILIGNNIFIEYKGAFAEQYVLQQIISRKVKPYYWSSEKTPSEIDFVIQRDDKIVPIEVKAEVNVKARSLRQFITNNPDLKGVRYSMLGYIDQGWVENVPLYAIDSYI